ncbi:Tn3 family transposase [Nonomuraea sp. NPDC050790]|uniref:Tn3 family transposase n=1 Tax=Nonomuraea sp. NPDC050790 TaxID=3364371 RepID=UPI0037A170AD
MLQFLHAGGYRRMIGAQLNVQEARHRPARKIAFGNRGQLRQRYREGMEDQPGAFGLALNAVIWWNTASSRCEPRCKAAATVKSASADLAGEQQPVLAPSHTCVAGLCRPGSRTGSGARQDQGVRGPGAWGTRRCPPWHAAHPGGAGPTRVDPSAPPSIGQLA